MSLRVTAGSIKAGPHGVREEVRIEVDVADRHLAIVACQQRWRAEVGFAGDPIPNQGHRNMHPQRNAPDWVSPVGRIA